MGPEDYSYYSIFDWRELCRSNFGKCHHSGRGSAGKPKGANRGRGQDEVTAEYNARFKADSKHRRQDHPAPAPDGRSQVTILSF